MKTAKVESVGQHIREWPNPKGGSIYYHEIVLDNGDHGSIGKKQPHGIKVGDEITYTIEYDDRGNKIKAVQPQFNGGFQGGAKRAQGSPASFALSYAKDLAVAVLERPNNTLTLDDVAPQILGVAERFNDWMVSKEKGTEQPAQTPVSSPTHRAEDHFEPPPPQHDAQFPSDPIAKTLSDMLTTKQQGMIQAICRENGWNENEECMSVMKCKVAELSRRAASSFIDHLLALAGPQR
jgi:hypothetical protein